MSADIIARLPTLHGRTVAVERLLDRLVELESINKDLLEACKAALEALDIHAPEPNRYREQLREAYREQLREVIAKAEGK